MAYSEQATERKTIVLVGGGHAHAQVIKEYNRVTCPSWADVILIDPLKSASYSGMVPGCVAEQYTQEQTQIHLEPLAKWAGTRYINARVVGIDPEAQTLLLGPSPYTNNEAADIPEKVRYDVVSFDIGCRTAHTNIPGVSEFAIATRPIHLLVERIDERVKSFSGDTLKLVVCGAGAAGMELAFTAAAKIKKAGKKVETVLVNAQDKLLPADPPMVADAMAKLVAARDITVIHQRHVQSVTATEVVLDNGEHIPCDLAIWPTGAASHAVAENLAAAGVATSDKGWIRVANTLQSISYPQIFAAGDCCTFENVATQPGKAGVYAVRTGPVLINNLLGFLNQLPLQEYNPQPEFLRLFNFGDGYGFGIRFGIAMYGEWVWLWKDYIDQWFMNLFKEENLPDLTTIATADTSQFDAALRSSISNAPEDATAAAVILTSTQADLQVVKDIINKMTGDDTYRQCVVDACATCKLSYL